MALSHILNEFITEESIKNLRFKELLLFLLGFAFNQLGQFWSDLNKAESLRLNTNLDIFTDQFMNSKAKQSYIANKCKVIFAFQTVLNIFSYEKETINTLKLSFQKLIQLFLEVLNQYLIIEAYTQNSQNESSQLKNCLHRLIQLKAQKTLFIGESNIFQQMKQKHNQFGFNVTKLEGQTVKKIQKLCEICEICYYPLDISCQQNMSKKQTIRISKCGHQYHKKCIQQMIQNYINDNSSILYQSKGRQKIQQLQGHKSQLQGRKSQLQGHKELQGHKQQLYGHKQQLYGRKDWLTLLKCPGYEKCSVHINFFQIHEILLNSSDQNNSKYLSEKTSKHLQRLFSMAFNDHINCRNITPFRKLGQYFSSVSNDQEHQKAFTKDFLFFCDTNGCNAIYEIDKNSVRLNLANGSLNDSLQNFTCLSCNQSYCLKCFSVIHPTMTCKQFAISSNYLPEDRELENFIKTLRRPYMQCPKCHFYVDNWRGCSTITCRCGVRFCYKCGSTQCPYAKCLKQIAKQSQTNRKKEEQQN